MSRTCRLFMIGFFLLIGCNLTQSPTTISVSTAVPTLETLTCDALINTAVDQADNACDLLSRNQVCYGYNTVKAEFETSTTETFALPGDKASLFSMQSLSTTPYDEASQEWGIALIEAQANIPDTLPGQNVTFILFGDTTMSGVTPQMQAITLSTGIGQVTCANTPPPAVLVQSPEGVSVTMNFNGASIELGSTVHIRALKNNTLAIATLEGVALVTAFDTIQTVLPGAQVELPLGTTDGLQVVGPPSSPTAFDLDAIRYAPLTLLKRPVTLPQPWTRPVSPTAILTATSPAAVAPPTAVLPDCVVRSDWTGTYTIQSGNTLYQVAQNYGLTVAELQQGNCLADPNLIGVGQVLRVPFQPTNTPLPPATPTHTPTATNTPTEVLKIDQIRVTLPFDTLPATEEVLPAQTQEPIR